MSKASEMALEKAKKALEANKDNTKNNIPTEEEAQREIDALRAEGFKTGEEVVKQEALRAKVQAASPTPEVQAPKVAVETEEKKAPAKEPIDVISSLPGAPSKAELMQMKNEHGEVLFIPLKDDEVYIYRYLKHIEWYKQILTQTQLVENEDALREAVLQRCLLWPKYDPIQMNAKQAGLRDLLFEVIMKSSYFIEPEQAMNLVMRL